MGRIILVPLLCYAFSSIGQQVRTEYTINENWRFTGEGIDNGQHKSVVDDCAWELVNIPHTWNSADPFDDTTGYKRGIGWYRKHLDIPRKSLKGKRVFIYLEGANQVTDVYVNNRIVGRHKGGYTAFTFDITDALEEQDQLVAISVNNSHDPYIPPLAIGYALYGGIYRDVWIIITNDVHFDFSEYGSRGIKISTPVVSNDHARVVTESNVINQSKEDQNVELVTQLSDANDNLVAEIKGIKTLHPGEHELFNQMMEFKDPKLWSPDDPYLYTITSTIKINGREVDKTTTPLGLRWFSFDPDSGFSINGKYVKLKGTNRHQDFKGKGSALSNKDHRRDMEMIKNMGCNFIRLAHYPQDPEVLRAADELGLIVWEEIPFINYINVSPEFYANAETMIKEMIRQHYNHPSVVMWGAMNEIFLYGPNEDRIQLQNDTTYARNVRKIAVKLDSVIRSEDPGRYTTMAMHMSSDYERYGVEKITEVDGFNVYSGWYSGALNDFGKSFDRRHQRNPGQVIIISEYGAGSDRRLNSNQPVRFDFTGQYQIEFHESYLRQINERKFIAGAAIWNEFDFSQPHTGGSIPHLNQKGMITWDRHPKDVYYLYKANWNPEPMVYIAEKDWPVRASISAHPSYTISVFANTTKVDLYVNGEKAGSRKPNDVNKATWPVKLHEGNNLLKAVSNVHGEEIEDVFTITVNKVNSREFTAMRINVGSGAQYLDNQSQPWIEDSPFNGVYGFEDGKAGLVDRKKIIRGTTHDPMFYSYLEGMKNYKVMVPDGTYSVRMFFLENMSIKPGERVFDVSVNGTQVIDNLDLVKEAGLCYGMKKTFRVEVKNNELNINFLPEKGDAILSGLEVLKID